MDEDTFWLRLWQTIAATVVALVLSAAGCTAYESNLIANAIAGGADPIDARCGIAGTSSSRDQCLLRSQVRPLAPKAD